MSEPVTTHTVQLPPPSLPTKKEREYRAFLGRLSELMKSHEGKYVAIHDGNVVAEGTDKVAVTLEAFHKVGYIELYVGLVKEPPVEVVRIPHYRLLAQTGSS